MKTISIALAGAFWALVLSSPLAAQPILNRVEQLLRQQLAAPRDAAANPNATNEPGYLGIIADDRQDPGRGVRITNVVPNGPGAQGGLQTGDLITAINGQAVRKMDDMGQVLEPLRVGAQLTITIDRGGSQSQKQVTLGRRAPTPATGNAPEVVASPRPAPTPEPPSAGPKLGIRTIPVSDEARQQNNLPNTQGAVVISVASGSIAERAGVPLGAVITAVNNRPVNSPDELAAAVRRAGSGSLVLSYFEAGKQTHKQVPLADPKLAAGEGPKLEVRVRPIENPGPTADGAALDEPASAEAREKALEERVRQLEARIEKLEAAAAEARKFLPR